MILPNKAFKTFISVLLLFSVTLSSVGPAFAQSEPEPVKPVPPQIQEGDQEVPGTIRLIPLPDGNYKITPGDPASSSAMVTQTALSCGWFSAACDIAGNAFGKIKDGVLKAISAGLDLALRFPVSLILGSKCSAVDQPVGRNECNKEYAALFNGGTVADIENPGALVLLAGYTDQALKMPIPIDSTQYFASINPFKQASAKTGFEDLNDSGLLKLWTNFRNAAYALSVLILIIVGFMIMVRFKLDPRTAVTAASALPRVIIVLILITFSFAIAGIMIDIARVATQLVYLLIPGDQAVQFFTLLIIFIALAFVSALGGPLGVGLAIGMILLVLILVVILLVVLAMVLWKIITRYVTFIIMTVFAPAVLLLAAIPGQEGLAIGYFKRMFAAIIAIPAILLILRLAFYIGLGAFGGSDTVRLPLPFFSPEAEGKLSAGPFGLWIFIQPLIALGVLFMATKVPDIVDEAFAAKPLAPRGGIGPGAIPGFIAGSAMNASTAMRGYGNLGQFADTYASMPGWRGVLGKAANTLAGKGRKRGPGTEPSGETLGKN